MDSYSIVFLAGNRIYHYTMKPMETLTIGSGKKNTIFAEGVPDSLIRIFNNYNGLYFTVKHPYNIAKENLGLNRLLVIDQQKGIGLYASIAVADDREELVLPYNGILKIGRGDKNNVIIRNRYVSHRHFQIRIATGIVRFEDQNSTNGIFLNGKKTDSGSLKPGDVLSNIGFKIIYNNNSLIFEGMGDSLFIQDNTLDFKDVTSGQEKDKYKTPVFKRSPRMMSQLPQEEITLAAPPAKGQRFERPGGMLASLLGTGTMFAASMAMGAASPAFMAARAAMLVSPIASAGTQGKANKKRKKQLEKYEEKRRVKYGKYIQNEKARIEAVAKEQRDIITAENPSPQECLTMVADVSRRLFERTAADRDFLDIRLGMGYEELCVPVKSPSGAKDFHMENDEVRDLVEELIEDTKYVDYVPFRLKLKQFSSIGVIGAREKVISMIYNLIVNLVATHFYRDVKIIGVFDEEEREIWEPLRWLPHIWDDNKDSRYLAFTKEEKELLCERVNAILEYRKRSKSEFSYGKEEDPHPYYIFLAGSKKHMKQEVLMKNLMLGQKELGISTLFLFDDIYSIPYGCKYIVDISEDCIAYESDKHNLRQYFTKDPQISRNQLDQFTRKLAAIKVEGFTEATGIPESVTFLEGYGVKKVEDLAIADRWKNNLSFESLSAPIGLMGGGKTFSLDIGEKAHGPHGLVAGTTGSGKSELLISWILSMAVNYHPHDVAFVLIDYKGGGMANLLDKLPHVVGKITNIGTNINRSLVSLESETKKRMEMFARYSSITGVTINNINQYQKLYRAGKIDTPLPHLILVADEFAELKKNEPEFMSGLVSVARVGRSLGIHMVLATQKPSGVVDDQIWANSQFRLCLKVQSAADSREMLKNPDAAAINRPGRLYVQVGENEVYELVQSYWSGAPYAVEKAEIREDGNQLKIVTLAGNRYTPIKKKKVQTDVDEVAAISRAIINLTKSQGIDPLDGPWLPELPEYITLDKILGEKGFHKGVWACDYEWLKVPVGLYDDPAHQAQGIEVIDFVESGHLGIYGAPSTGKTTLMKTIILSAALNYTPNDVQMYILDCGGWSTSEMVHLPHVGGVALDCETEKIEKLEKLMWNELERRKNMLLRYHVSSLEAYRESISKDMPAIFFCIDNFPAVFELFPDMENLFITLSNQGAAYGIYLIYTANSTTGIRFKVMQNIKNAIAFEMTDRGDYPTLVGRLEGVAPSHIQGRGIRKGSPPIEMHSAIYIHGETEAVMSTNLRELMQEMTNYWDGPLPDPIPVMPQVVTKEDIIVGYTVRNHIPVGLSYETIRPLYVDMSERYNLLITGERRSGKTGLLKDIFSMIHEKNPSDLLFVFDSKDRKFEEFAEKTADYAVVDDANGIDRILNRIINELNERVRNRKKQKKENPEEFSDEIYVQSLPQIVIFIDNLKEYVDEVEDESLDSMIRIVHLAQGLGVMVFAACSIGDLAGYAAIESLTIQMLKNQQGILLSGNALTAPMFKENLSYSEKSVDLKEQEGFYFNNGTCTKFRRRDS